MKGIPALRQNIIQAFILVPHPDPDRITPYPCCTDHDFMTDWFRLHTWKEFQKLLEEDTLDTEFMPTYPEGFIYFLPAVLLYTLDSYEQKKVYFWEFVAAAGKSIIPVIDWIRVLIPLFEEPYISEMREIRNLLSSEQIAAIIEYLSFFMKVCPEEQDHFRMDAQRALSEVWRQVQMPNPLLQRTGKASRSN